MDQVKVGKFIAECRKNKNLTQFQLAEKLNITDRAISKWETGKGMPDSSIMLELCNELGISVNELLSGEVIKMDNYNEKLEQNLIEMVKQKEQSDKKLLTMEIVMGVTTVIMYLAIILIASFVEIQDWIRGLTILFSTTFFVIICFLLLQIEQVSGYYECRKCLYKYVPTYKQVLWARHIGRTRYMKCPKCNQKSWQKKVTSK